MGSQAWKMPEFDVESIPEIAHFDTCKHRHTLKGAESSTQPSFRPSAALWPAERLLGHHHTKSAKWRSGLIAADF